MRKRKNQVRSKVLGVILAGIGGIIIIHTIPLTALYITLAILCTALVITIIIRR